MGIKDHKKLIKTRGFTIIEVMIVLAIAALIMVIVFLAVPQLQKSSRDTERKQYAREVFTQMENFYSNNGRYPDTTASSTDRQKFIDEYMPKDKDPLTGTLYTDPSSVTYSGVGADHTAIPNPGQIFIASDHWCYDSAPDGTNNPIVGGASVIRFVIWIGLEKGQYYCVDNHE